MTTHFNSHISLDGTPTLIPQTSAIQSQLKGQGRNDNDMYGHMNNTVYLQIIDSVINIYLIDQCDLDRLAGPCFGNDVWPLDHASEAGNRADLLPHGLLDFVCQRSIWDDRRGVGRRG
ncbi:hypothetical protein SI65_06469 [Aspergillus cristatus]|uniref:Thioesterase domain-containing protein n=1 Tax=Aspergillus cristatus TaxID=573508 RepID=A0A1E3BA63_ASPCR|nr:hypothetical protein SI65_06469 [Aspergillus cristatus]